jgi:ABC-type spermidine/putrescine transport system permease subunit II
MVNVGIFYDHLEYFTPIWYNLGPIGIVCGHLEYFSPFWYVWTKKNLATLPKSIESGQDFNPTFGSRNETLWARFAEY